jgi:hypothetical protein
MPQRLSSILATCVLITAAAPAAFADSVRCKSITAVQRDALTSDGCPSPIGFCAAGTIKGNHGLRGTNFFSALAFDPIPSDPLGRLAVPGLSTFTFDDGVLNIEDASIFDVAAGTFAGVGRITGGTGRFAGATGEIFTTGRVGPDGTTFVTNTTGEICVPR